MVELDSREIAERAEACLLGGAIGDALGAAVEFLSLDEIRARFGAAGVTDFVEAYGRVGAITDDTQMTLFTAEGVVQAYVRYVERGICHPPSMVHLAYLRWLFTQGTRASISLAQSPSFPEAGLARDARLCSRRGPGATCLEALSAAQALGAPAVNDRKGCGTVMRVAPIGLALKPEAAFDLGVASSALTHGHPTGFLAGGAFAFLIALLLQGASLLDGVKQVRGVLSAQPSADETLAALDAAVKLAAAGGEPTTEKVESLGGGWVAEEALSIALYSALVARSFEQGVLLAVNHSGDSDSTGSLTGQLLGLTLGLSAIPHKWRSWVELADLLRAAAADLAAVRTGKLNTRAWAPGWRS